jgi:hypothetical protein
MSRSTSQLLSIAARLTAIGGSLGILAGVVQAVVGSRIPDWSGNKGQPVALGLLTIALGASVVVTARRLRTAIVPSAEALTAITLWLAAVALLCSTTVGRLWFVPGALLLAAAGVTFSACGWYRFRSVIATHWLRGLHGVLGAFAVLMAVSASSLVTIAAGLVGGAALIVAAIMFGPGKRTLVIACVALTLPFAALTWWTIVTPLLTIVAFAIGLIVTTPGSSRVDARTVEPLDPQPVG